MNFFFLLSPFSLLPSPFCSLQRHVYDPIVLGVEIKRYTGKRLLVLVLIGVLPELVEQFLESLKRQQDLLDGAQALLGMIQKLRQEGGTK